MSSVPPPEDAWLPFIRDIYPDRNTKTYFLPPLHFNKVPYSVLSWEGEDVVVYEHLPPVPNPRRGRAAAPPPAGPDPQVAGTVFTRHPAGLQPRRLLDTDLQDDLAQETVLQCLRALGETTQQAMMVISQLEFRHYLDHLTDPVHAAAAAMLPNLPSGQRDGECDIIIIHKTHGLVVGEMKSVGGNDYFAKSSEGEQNRVIVLQVEKAVKQLNQQEGVLCRLVSDLGVKVTKLLLLPNVTSGQLMRALNTNGSVAQALCQCVDTPDLSVAVSRCLCKDNMPSTEDLHFLASASTEDLHYLASAAHLTKWARLRAAIRRVFSRLRARLGANTSTMTSLTSWWRHAVLDRGADPRMTDDVYDRLLARFCGPATTVDVPTVGRPRKVVRSQGLAVAETGLIVSSLALYPQQVDILSSPRDSLYLWGGPGTGKTLLLFLKCKQWLNQQREVHVVSTSDSSHAVNWLIHEQLRATLGAAATASTLHFHHWNLFGGVDVSDVVTQLAALSRGHLYLIVDEVDDSVGDKFIAMCKQLHNALQGRVSIWAASVWKPHSPLPPWLSVETLTIPLRSPPAVHREVQQSVFIDDSDVPRYSSAAIPAATDGQAVRRLQHKEQAGHTGDSPEQCERCGHNVAEELRELGVGQAGAGSLEWRDVLILCDNPSPSLPMVRALLASHIPLCVLPQFGASQAALRDLATATTDQVTVAHYDTVAGLERRVVVGMGGVWNDRLSAMSRCTSFLIWIDDPDDF